MHQCGIPRIDYEELSFRNLLIEVCLRNKYSVPIDHEYAPSYRRRLLTVISITPLTNKRFLPLKLGSLISIQPKIDCPQVYISPRLVNQYTQSLLSSRYSYY